MLFIRAHFSISWQPGWCSFVLNFSNKFRLALGIHVPVLVIVGETSSVNARLCTKSYHFVGIGIWSMRLSTCDVDDQGNPDYHHKFLRSNINTVSHNKSQQIRIIMGEFKCNFLCRKKLLVKSSIMNHWWK